MGVTHGTVSRALKGDPRVNPRTAARILAAAEQLGYVRSRLAQGLRTNRSYILGILLANLSDPFFADVLQGVHDTIIPNGFHLMISSPHQTAVQGFLQQRVDGLFLGCAPDLSEAYQALMEAGTPPVVMLNHSVPGYPYCVANDERRAVMDCVAFLLSRGHRRLGYLGNAGGGSVNTARVASFRAAAPDGEVRLAAGGEMGDGLRGMASWLEDDELPDAVLCYNDLQAVGALRACREAGRRVNVMGFDDIELAGYVDPPLTTYAQRRYELGKQAAEMMLALLDGLPVPGPRLLEGGLVLRTSVSD